MIKAAIEKIVSLAAPNISELDGFTYSDKNLSRINEPAVESLQVHTLTAILDYVYSKPDGDVIEPQVLHVVGYDLVHLYAPLRKDKKREGIVTAKINDVSPRFGKWYDLESFNIMLQSRFVPTEDSKEILKLLGSVADRNIKNTGDNGITQQITVKTGVALLGNEIVPNPVTLKPYRTFLEVDQPDSQFVLRVKKQGDDIVAALFEADGGAWENQAISNIGTFFKDLPVVILA